MSLGNPSDPSTSGAPEHKRVPSDAVQLDPEGLKAYAHPLRMAILRYLQNHGAATSTSLAEHLSQSTGQTSYHLRQLAKHGLIEDVPGRGTGRERWWRGRSTGVDLATMLTDEATAHAADVLLAEMLRDRTETLARWIGGLSRAVEHEEIASRALHSQSTIMLTPDELAELSETLSETITKFTARFSARFDGDDDVPPDAVRVRAYIDVFPLLDDDAPGTAAADGDSA